MWTLSVFLTHFSTSLYSHPTFYLINIYSVYYILLDKNLGLIMTMVFYFNWITSYYFYWYVSNSIYYASILHIFSWISQFVGHFYFEGNRPALTDSLIQAFLVAPIFVLIDIKHLFKNINLKILI